MPSERAVIVLNGPFHTSKALRREFEGALIIAADGGYTRLARLGITPHLVIGDFDSAVPPEGVETAVYPAEKDETDGELALGHALRAGVRRVTILGAMGGRYDMAVGHLALLRKARLGGAMGVLTDGRQCAILVPDRHQPVGPRGRELSIIALTEEARLQSHGLRWPLDGMPIRSDAMKGISNRVELDDAWVMRDSGEALLVAAYPLPDRTDG